MPRRGPVQMATQREIDALAGRDETIGRSATAAVAVALAKDIDAPRTSPTARSMSAARHEEAMATLRALAPPEQQHDDVDDISDELAARRAQVASGARGAGSGG